MIWGHPDKTKLNPLSPFALGELDRIARAPVPTLEINHGVLDRLLRGRLVEVVEAMSPYKSHKKGQRIPHAKITEAGARELGLTVPQPKKAKKAQ